MPWVRLEDNFYDHQKFVQAGPLGIALWTVSLAWSNRNLTDGFVPTAKARTMLDWDGIAWHMWSGEFMGGGEDTEGLPVAEHLVTCGLFERVTGGYQIHDYCEYQPTADEILAQRLVVSEQRREAGRKGGLTTQHLRRSDEANKQTPSKPASKVEANGVAKSKPQPQPQLEEEAKASSRERDWLFEALAVACEIDWHRATKSERGKLNKATGELRAVDATPPEVHRRAALYRRRWPVVSLTPTALAAHWSELEHEQARAATGNDAVIAAGMDRLRAATNGSISGVLAEGKP